VERGRARDFGVSIGRMPTGRDNAITDVEGVRVGHVTLLAGLDGDPHAIRTGVTTIFPHVGDPWNEPVYAGVHILNGYGETIGVNHLAEWGILMTPIALTSTAQIGRVYDATLRWTAARDERGAREIMPVVSECDDSYLNDILSFPLTDEHVAAALDGAAVGAVHEGSVGAGFGMQCFDFKGGIGTASRVLSAEAGGFTVGVLALTNHGERAGLRIDGAPIGLALADDLMPGQHTEGSCVVVVATDAPLLPHQLRRMAVRAGMGLARGGSHASNGSGEQMLAFSTANHLALDGGRVVEVRTISDGVEREPWVLSALFEAVVEATEEAVVNALFTATTVVGRDGHVLHAMPIERALEVLTRYGRLGAGRTTGTEGA
jgi:D-aminopeptidase